MYFKHQPLLKDNEQRAMQKGGKNLEPNSLRSHTRWDDTSAGCSLVQTRPYCHLPTYFCLSGVVVTASPSFFWNKKKKSPPELLYVYWFGWFAACVTQSIINLIQRAPFERLWLSTISSVTLGFRVQKVQIAQTKGPYSPWFNSSNLANNCHKVVILELNKRKIWTRIEIGESCLDKGVFLIS